MTKQARNIIKKDFEKYIKLAEMSEEDRKVYQKVANMLSEILDK